MRKYSYIGISFIILVFGILFIPKIIDRIKSGSIVKDSRMSAGKLDNNQLAYIKINGKPKKIPDFAFLNQDSLLVTNHDLKGKVYVLDFFFTSCPTICPKMTKNLSYLENKFKNNPDFGIASFTIDPEKDTPKRLKQYAQNYKITDPDWHLLTGDREDIYDLANRGFNIYAAEVPSVPGGFEHNGFFALIDKEGYIRSSYDASGNPIIYYRGTVSIKEGQDENGEKEQITLLEQDIEKLLAE